MNIRWDYIAISIMTTLGCLFWFKVFDMITFNPKEKKIKKLYLSGRWRNDGSFYCKSTRLEANERYSIIINHPFSPKWEDIIWDIETCLPQTIEIIFKKERK